MSGPFEVPSLQWLLVFLSALAGLVLLGPFLRGILRGISKRLKEAREAEERERAEAEARERAAEAMSKELHERLVNGLGAVLDRKTYNERRRAEMEAEATPPRPGGGDKIRRLQCSRGNLPALPGRGADAGGLPAGGTLRLGRGFPPRLGGRRKKSRASGKQRRLEMTDEQRRLAENYREALTRAARDLKRAQIAASAEMGLFPAHLVSEGRESIEYFEERLVRLACTWGGESVTFDELKRFVDSVEVYE